MLDCRALCLGEASTALEPAGTVTGFNFLWLDLFPPAVATGIVRAETLVISYGWERVFV